MTEWTDLNPLLQWCDNYEIVEIRIDEGLRTRISDGIVHNDEKVWTVSGSYIPDWQTCSYGEGRVCCTSMFAESYSTPQKAQEVYHRIIRMARKVYWTYDQPPPGRLPQ